MRYWTQLAMEQFPPSSIVEQAVGAERAGCLQNASGADPLRALEIYGERVLPTLRGSRAAASASTT